jgi:hypothetical protein
MVNGNAEEKITGNPNEKEKLLEKILNKFTPKMVTFILAIFIFAAMVVVLIAIKNGSVVDFKNLTITPRDRQNNNTAIIKGVPAKEFVLGLPIEVQGTIEVSKKNISELVNKSKQMSLDIDTLTRENDDYKIYLEDIRKELEKTKKEILVLEQTINEDKYKFLDRIIRLDKQITRWNGFINTAIDVDEKQVVFELLQQLLMRIGYYEGAIDSDRIRAVEALRFYKKEKGLEENYWSDVTRNTVIYLVGDYADVLLAEAKG